MHNNDAESLITIPDGNHIYSQYRAIGLEMKSALNSRTPVGPANKAVVCYSDTVMHGRAFITAAVAAVAAVGCAGAAARGGGGVGQCAEMK